VTAVAGFRVAGYRSGRATTSATGPRAVPPRSRTSRCCAGAITAPFTRRGTRSNDSPTARCASGGRTEDCYSTCHRRQPFRMMLPPRSERPTRRPDSGCTGEPPAPAGRASASTWDGRSTSCTRERSANRTASLGRRITPPPVTLIDWPVIYSDASPARKAATSATSSGRRATQGVGDALDALLAHEEIDGAVRLERHPRRRTAEQSRDRARARRPPP
jgi:hypothetical protein